MRTRDIVVAADGTPSSTDAVSWAAREARRRNLRLRVVHVFDWEWHESRSYTGGDYLEMARRTAENIAGNAVRHALSVAPHLDAEPDPLIGHAAARLLDEGDNAELMVLGSRGRGGFGSLLLGSVSQRVATHAACPVVVVRGRGDVTTGPVAVGVDDSPSADHVLETAFEEAAGRGTSIVAVRAYLPEIPPWLRDMTTPEADAEERARLDEQLTPWRDKYPQVPVEVMLTPDSPAAALVTASAGAQLVVVGSRGHGVITGVVIGSVGLQLLHHADCPVYVVRERRS